jgi:anti-sigma B factor antagonist/stage II sporulation protein AA (anti-sigma F factor antagonist)
MEGINRTVNEDIIIEKVNLVRATMNEAQQIKDTLMEDILEYRKIIIDLSSCEYIDSTFLGALVYAYRQIKSKNGLISLVVSDTFMIRTFIFKDIEEIFKMHNSLQRAIDELRKDEFLYGDQGDDTKN